MNTRKNTELMIILNGNLPLSKKWLRPYRQRLPQPAEGGLWVTPHGVPAWPVSHWWWLLLGRLHSWASLQTHLVEGTLGAAYRQSCGASGLCPENTLTQRKLLWPRHVESLHVNTEVDWESYLWSQKNTGGKEDIRRYSYFILCNFFPQTAPVFFRHWTSSWEQEPIQELGCVVQGRTFFQPAFKSFGTLNYFFSATQCVKYGGALLISWQKIQNFHQ